MADCNIVYGKRLKILNLLLGNSSLIIKGRSQNRFLSISQTIFAGNYDDISDMETKSYSKMNVNMEKKTPLLIILSGGAVRLVHSPPK